MRPGVLGVEYGFSSRDTKDVFPAVTEHRNRPVVLMLAAGQARRFGSDKRITLLCQSETLLERSVRSALEAELTVIVCLSTRRADDVIARSMSRFPVRVLRCARAEEGMGGTLAEGIAACSGYPGAFVALGDMPYVDSRTYRHLAQQHAPGRIVVPECGGQRGHPVLFDAVFFEELGDLSGDRGAARLLKRHAASCIRSAVRDPGIHRDVDRPGDLVGK
jgi:molybdenum cofactor cytidylyltransferase